MKYLSSLLAPKLTRLFCHQAHSCPARGWSGAGVGVGILRGYHDVSRSRRFKKMILRKIPRFHAHPKLFKQIQSIFKNNLFYPKRITYVLTLSWFQRFLNIPPSHVPFFFCNTIKIEDCFGPTTDHFLRICGVPNFPFFLNSGFPTSWWSRRRNVSPQVADNRSWGSDISIFLPQPHIRPTFTLPR